MNLPFHIARRYLFAKKSTNAVNWITGISAVGVMVGTAAMVVVLSAFAGLDDLVRGFYNSFDPDLKIIPSEGKFRNWTPEDQEALVSFEEVSVVSRVIEDKALFRFRDREYIAHIKGVDTLYTEVCELEPHIIQGTYLNPYADRETAVMGSGVSAYLGVSLGTFTPVNIYVPRGEDLDRLNPMGNVRLRSVYPVGIFQIQPEFDSKYVFTSLEFARGLFATDSAISALEVKLVNASAAAKIKKQLEEKLDGRWKVLDRDDLQVAIFKVLKSEGLITYLVLTFILLVASFGILSSVNILIIEKKGDLHTLWSMGASERLLRRIFMTEGLLISLGGAGTGFILGIVVVLLQKHLGLLSMGPGYVVEYYPVEIRARDLIQVILTILAVGIGISWLAVRRLKADKLK